MSRRPRRLAGEAAVLRDGVIVDVEGRVNVLRDRDIAAREATAHAVLCHRDAYRWERREYVPRHVREALVDALPEAS